MKWVVIIFWNVLMRCIAAEGRLSEKDPDGNGVSGARTDDLKVTHTTDGITIEYVRIPEGMTNVDDKEGSKKNEVVHKSGSPKRTVPDGPLSQKPTLELANENEGEKGGNIALKESRGWSVGRTKDHWHMSPRNRGDIISSSESDSSVGGKSEDRYQIGLRLKVLGQTLLGYQPGHDERSNTLNEAVRLLKGALAAEARAYDYSREKNLESSTVDKIANPHRLHLWF